MPSSLQLGAEVFLSLQLCLAALSRHPCELTWRYRGQTRLGLRCDFLRVASLASFLRLLGQFQTRRYRHSCLQGQLRPPHFAADSPFLQSAFLGVLAVLQRLLSLIGAQTMSMPALASSETHSKLCPFSYF